MTRPEALRDAAARLAGASDTPRLDAELLLAHALRVTREELLLRADGAVPAEFAALVARRERHEPIAYIVGSRAFWTSELAVGPGVLVPRADSETLIEAAVGHFRGTPGPRTVLDLGTGSGALLLAALNEWPGARGIGVDASADARDWAARNVARLGCADRAAIVAGGWAGTGARFDLVLCNPPYIATGEALPREVADWEPAAALFAGVDGLAEYRAIAPRLGAQLAPGGVACVEVGWTQSAAAGALFAAAGLGVAIRHDLGGRARCLMVTPGK